MNVNSKGVQGHVVRSSRQPGVVCHEVLYDSGTTLDAHVHDSTFIVWSMDGRYRESACGSEFACHPRSIVFHPAREEHAVFIGDTTVRCFVIELDAAEMQQRYGAKIPASLLHVDSSSLATVLANLYGEFRVADASSSLAIQGLVLQLLAGLSRTDTREIDHGRPTWLDRIQGILQSDFRSRLTLEDIAEAVGQSPARVSAVFRRVHRRSIAEERRRLRVEFARERLRDRDASLADIAVEAGFSDQPHFSRAFKQLTGTTPARYRLITYGACEEA